MDYIAGLDYDWPGNVRELKSVLKYLSVMYRNTEGMRADLAFILEEMSGLFFPSAGKGAGEALGEPALDGDALALLKAIQEMVERRGVAGRYSLSKRPEIQDRHLTEAEIKAQLARLADEGYVQVRTTRQGVRLTDKGLDAIR